MVGAKVARSLELNQASFDGYLNAESIQIGGPLIALPRGVLDRLKALRGPPLRPADRNLPTLEKRCVVT
jgi:hypothetical protein